MGRFGKKFLLFCLSIGLIVLFQNCIEATVQFGQEEQSSTDDGLILDQFPTDDREESSGNGEGYGGRTDGIGAYYVYNYDDPCTDPNDPNPTITDIIEEENGEYILLKENCQIVTPTVVTNQVSIDPNNPEVLTYNNESYEGLPESSGVPTPTTNIPNLKIYCQSQVYDLGGDDRRIYQFYIIEPPADQRRFRAERVDYNTVTNSRGSSNNEYNTDQDIIINNDPVNGLTTTWDFNDNSGVFSLKVDATDKDGQYESGNFSGTLYQADPMGNNMDVGCSYHGQ